MPEYSDPASASPVEEGEGLARAAQSKATPVSAEWSLILLLAGVTAIGPFAMQAIAPGLPGFSRAMQVSEGAAQAMISAAMLCASLGAVIYGPLADRYGRRPVLLGAMLLSAIGALAAAAAPVFGGALAGRIVQSLGAAAGMVLARAVAQDLYGSRGAHTVISKITALMVVAPMLAPAAGGVLAGAFGWRGVFVAIGVVSVGLTIWVYYGFRESARVFSPKLDIASALGDFRGILAKPAFLGHAAMGSALLASFFMFVSGAPYLFERGFGIGPTGFGMLFIIAAFVYMMANLASPRVSERLGRGRTMQLGAALAMAGPIGGALVLGLFHSASGPGADWTGAAMLMAGLSLHSVGTGLAMPNAIAGAVAASPERAGSASSLFSVLQFGAAAASAQVAGFLHLEQGPPLLLSMALLSGLGLVGLILSEK